MIPPKARAGNTERPTLSESIRFVSDRPVGSNKAVTQIARNAKSPFVTGRRVTADETRKKNGGCPRARRGRRETNRSMNRSSRLNAGSLTAIPWATHLPDIHPLLPLSFADWRVWPNWNQFHLSVSQASPRAKEIVYPVVVRTRSIIEILPYHNSAPGLSHLFLPLEKFQLFGGWWIYLIPIYSSISPNLFIWTYLFKKLKFNF